MDEELVQNVLMDEDWRQNGVMCAQIREELFDECQKIVRNFVMGAKIDP